MRRGGALDADGDGDGGGDAVAAAGAEELALGVASGIPELIGSIKAPWSGSETATSVPSGEMAIGPSSGPSFNGNGLSTPASALSQYHVPVPYSRTASSPDTPGAAPSVKKAACAGGLASPLSALAARVRARPPTS